jgi:sugar-specific transcriptional regulator TrmB
MAEVIAKVRKEMKDRLREIEAELAAVEALVAEMARLERALAAPPFADAAPARKRRATRPRAPRGANRAAVYAALETMPGASVGELAAASGVARPQVYALLRKGIEEGRVKTDELAGGQTGYRIAAQPETAFPAPAPPALEPEEAEPAADVS